MIVAALFICVCPDSFILISQVFKSLKLFIKHKDPEDDLFDRITVSVFVGRAAYFSVVEILLLIF